MARGLAYRAAGYGASRLAWPLLRRRGEGTAWRDRWSAHPPAAAVDVWIHTPSLGEIAPLAALVAETAASLHVGVTVTSGRSLKGLVDLFGPHADVRPLPLPGSPALAGLIRAWRPRRLVLLEAEAWPELLLDVPAGGATVSVLGGRVGKAAGWVWRRALARGAAWLAGAWVAGEREAAAYRRVGVDPARIHTGYFAKFLSARAAAIPEEFRRWRQGPGPFVVVGSLHPDEVAPLAPVWRTWAAGGTARWLIVPRHPDRTSAVARAFQRQGIAAAVWPDTAAFTLVPRFGVLAGTYGLADAALVGGSWNDAGGHNPLEATAHGVPVLMGPSIGHQRDLLSALPSGLVTVAAAAGAAAALHKLAGATRAALTAALQPHVQAAERAARAALAA